MPEHDTDTWEEYDHAANTTSGADAVRIVIDDLAVDLISNPRADFIRRPRADEALRTWRDQARTEPFERVTVDEAVAVIERSKAAPG